MPTLPSNTGPGRSNSHLKAIGSGLGVVALLVILGVILFFVLSPTAEQEATKDEMVSFVEAHGFVVNGPVFYGGTARPDDVEVPFAVPGTACKGRVVLEDESLMFRLGDGERIVTIMSDADLAKASVEDLRRHCQQS